MINIIIINIQQILSNGYEKIQKNGMFVVNMSLLGIV